MRKSGWLFICVYGLSILKFDIGIVHAVCLLCVSLHFHIDRVLLLVQWIIRKRPQLVNDIKRFPETYHGLCL